MSSADRSLKRSKDSFSKDSKDSKGSKGSKDSKTSKGSQGTKSRSVTAKVSIRVDQIFFKHVTRQLTDDLLRKPGEFLLRRSPTGVLVLSVRGPDHNVKHFNFGYGGPYRVGNAKFSTMEELVNDFFQTKKPLAKKSGIRLLYPTFRTYNIIKPEKITFLKKLGKGNFGEVWHASLETKQGNEEIAIKMLTGAVTPKQRAECLDEAKLTSLLKHPNIVQLKGICLWKVNESEDRHLLLALEYCNAGSLDTMLKQSLMSEDGKKLALLDSAQGIEYLHSRNVIHRDIASRNCLVQRMADNNVVVKIADFGLSRITPDIYTMTQKRRLPIYATAPETLKMRNWTTKSDVWSFGIMMLEIYNKAKNPYEEYYFSRKVPAPRVADELLSGYRLPPPFFMSTPMAKISEWCLSNPAERPKMSQVVVAIRKICPKAPPR